MILSNTNPEPSVLGRSKKIIPVTVAPPNLPIDIPITHRPVNQKKKKKDSIFFPMPNPVPPISTSVFATIDMADAQLPTAASKSNLPEILPLSACGWTFTIRKECSPTDRTAQS
jgi:hypothetical protein